MSLIALGGDARPKRREKLFGDGRARPLDREAKVRVMARGRALMARTQAGKAYGPVTAKAFAVLQTLLWGFHNAESGLCFPSLETIAKRAKCARSTVATALKALESAGLLTWVNRIVRRRVHCSDDLSSGKTTRIRVMRTSNAYTFVDPAKTGDRPKSSKSDFRSGTGNQESLSLPPLPSAPVRGLDPPLALAIERLRRAMRLNA